MAEFWVVIQLELFIKGFQCILEPPVFPEEAFPPVVVFVITAFCVCELLI